jgi:hypothetical protein
VEKYHRLGQQSAGLFPKGIEIGLLIVKIETGLIGPFFPQNQERLFGAAFMKVIPEAGGFLATLADQFFDVTPKLRQRAGLGFKQSGDTQ